MLARGFAVVRDQAELALTRAAAVAPGQAVEIEFHDARRGAVINNNGRGTVMDGEGLAPKPRKEAKKKAKKKPGPKSVPKSKDDGQGTLL